MPTLPTMEEVRAWCQVSFAAVSNEQLQDVMDGEAANQAKACRIPDPADRDADLIQAFLRRVARTLAARGVPLGLTQGEYGPARLGSFDGEIERLEGYSRGFYFG
jgi:hypothetical protein